MAQLASSENNRLRRRPRFGHSGEEGVQPSLWTARTFKIGYHPPKHRPLFARLLPERLGLDLRELFQEDGVLLTLVVGVHRLIRGVNEKSSI